VQHGKYRRFREDSEARFVTDLSLSRRRAVTRARGTVKRYRGTRPRIAGLTRVGGGQERKSRGRPDARERYPIAVNRGKSDGSTANLVCGLGSILCAVIPVRLRALTDVRSSNISRRKNLSASRSDVRDAAPRRPVLYAIRARMSAMTVVLRFAHQPQGDPARPAWTANASARVSAAGQWRGELA